MIVDNSRADLCTHVYSAELAFYNGCDVLSVRVRDSNVDVLAVILMCWRVVACLWVL